MNKKFVYQVGNNKTIKNMLKAFSWGCPYSFRFTYSTIFRGPACIVE